VTARAFAEHPEQGRWTQHDLDQRLHADWFDPAGFLLAESGDRLLGYHWTKVHAELDPPVGEVYVLGVDPSAQGIRLGSALLAAGLRHLLGRGLHTVLLYVEQDNPAAVRLYRRAGFETFSTDIQYAVD
jgi:mycothiol synthase